MLAELAAPHTLFHQGDHVVGIEAHPAVRGDISKFAAIHHPLDLALPNTKNLADLLGSEHQPLRLDSHAVYDHLGHGHSLYRARDFWIKWPAMGVGVAVSVVAHAHGAAGRLQARVVAGAAVGLAIAWLLLALAPATALAAGPTWGVASEIQQPPDKSPGAGVSFLDHISCGAPGNCAAVGSYSLLNASGEGMMGVVGSGSIWGQASAILPPANSSIGRPLTTGPVACPPSGSCIAGGYYTAVGGEYGMVTSETGGVWSQGKEIALPANASTTLADIFLFGAACAAQGSCVVVGAYITGNGESAPLIVSENGGVWAQGIEPSLPAGANGAVASQLNGVACPAANACVAVGGYTESDGENHLWVLSQAAGKWGQASTIALPANAKSGSANSVACRSVGNCLMVGDYETSAEEHVGFVVTENAGVWGPASEVPVPGGSVDIGIESVACPPTGACVALGPDFVVNESAPGVWTATEIEVALPASAYEPYGTPNFALDSIACPVAGGCIIAGEYVSSVGGIVPIIVNETNGGPYNGAVAKTGPLLENTLSPSGGGTVEFSGTITPGNLASGLEWWFEYGPVGTNFNATACAESQTPCASGGPMETPRKQLSATPGTCPGIATPEPCVWARNTFPLSPYTPYEYRLVVQEGQQPPVFGATLPLIPGNLINPRNFKPTGRYNLAIVCPSACQTLLHADAQHAGGGLAFGQFALTSSTPAGEIGGLGEVLTLHNGKSPEKHGFLFKGNLLLSRVNMNLSPLPGPVTIASPFSLAGAVNYGHTGLEPFAFAGNLSGGGYWEACLQNTGAGSCSPPDHPDKTTAGTVSGVAGVASTAAGFAVIPGGQPVALALGVFSAVTLAISADPPDKHYKKITHPRHVRAMRVRPGHGLSRRVAAATSQFATALAQTGVAGNAFLAAWQRYQGASQTAEPLWLGRQYEATLQYGHEFVSDCRRAATILQAQHAVLASSPLGRKRLSARRLRELLRAARRHGVSRSLARQLARLGIPTTVVKAAGGAIPGTPPAGATTPLGPVLDPAFAAKLNELANGLDGYLANLAQHPFA